MPPCYRMDILMSAKTLLTLIALAAAVFLLQRCAGDPHATALPFGTTDLSSVEAQLAQLPAEERQLVEDYVRRSNGDVLPAQFADPDEPYTARTFAEAIKLQRAWVERMKVEAARADERQAERDAKLAPLRAQVRATVVKSEVVNDTPEAASGQPVFDHSGKQPYFAVTVRVQNLSDDTIVELQGSLQARDRDSYLPLDLCLVELGAGRELRTGGTMEFPCGRMNAGVSTQQRDFMQNPPGRFKVVWEPRKIRFASGRELVYRD